jgi:c-di-GMP-binding flagellar brake protein YcgR
VDNFNLEVNDKLEVIMGDRAYKALIIDVQDDFLRINLPVNSGEYLVLNTGEEIEINSYLDENNCFSCQSKVIARGKEGSILYYTISKPFNIKKIQRRNFFRINVVREIKYKIITGLDQADIENMSYREGLMVDLSAGGMKLKLKDNLSLEDLLLIDLKINQVEMEIKCDIVRIEETEDKQIICGLSFRDITHAQSEAIIKELFEIARKQRANS